MSGHMLFASLCCCFHFNLSIVLSLFVPLIFDSNIKEEKKSFLSAHVHINCGWCTNFILREDREKKRRKIYVFAHQQNDVHRTNITARMPNSWNDWTADLRIQTMRYTQSKQSSDCAVVFFVYSPFHTQLIHTDADNDNKFFFFGYKLQLPSSSSPWSNWFNVCVRFYYFQLPMNVGLLI